MLGYPSAHADQCGVKVAPFWGYPSAHAVLRLARYQTFKYTFSFIFKTSFPRREMLLYSTDHTQGKPP